MNVTVDNFGMGHSPPSHLKRFPADTLKVDRSLTIGIAKDIEDRALVVAVVSLARALGRCVTACGVETAEQFQRLGEIGCDLAQALELLQSPPARGGDLAPRLGAPGPAQPRALRRFAQGRPSAARAAGFLVLADRRFIVDQAGSLGASADPRPC